MLSTSAFNALLKTMEEPPPHVIFILATTEVQKVPATILSRCQRYDFSRITAEDIAGRLRYVASQENFDLTDGAAQLIGRLADGAMRDALSILDTCAGVSTSVDEALVRRMAGVTDRAYLFEISDAIARQDAVAALQKVAELRQKSVDMRRLCVELAGHYRNLMLASLPQGTSLLAGVSPEEEAAYAARASLPQSEAVRGIEAFGDALEKMGRGTDQRIELELAIFSLTQPAARPVVMAGIPSAAQANPAQPVPFASVAVPAQPAPASVPAFQAPAPEPPVADTFQVSAPAASAPYVPSKEAQQTGRPAVQVHPPQPFEPWNAVLHTLQERDPALSSFLRGSTAYYDGKRVLIACSETFRDYMRKNKETGKTLKSIILEVSGIRCNIGPYEPKKTHADGQEVRPIEDTLKTMQSMGVDVVVEDK